MESRNGTADTPESREFDLLSELPKLRRPQAGEVPVSRIIDPMVREGELYEKMDKSWVLCYACGHRCKIPPGARGICQVRYNLNGRLYVPWGYVAALQCDPTEKKPYYHVYPGSDTLTFGMLGCDLHCPYCQNWDTSQTLRDANAGRMPAKMTPEKMVELARKYGARCIASSYNEPLITSEWAVAIFKLARQEGLTCLYVSNGNATREVLEYIRPYTQGYKIDLKSMNDRNYRKLGMPLQGVLDSIQMAHELGFWVEIVTLLIPGFNDSEAEIREAARFIKSVSADIPWHITAFHKDYKMTDPDNTDAETLIHAAEIGYEEGLNFVYAGNMPGQVDRYENTYCPKCRALLIERFGYVVLDYRLTESGCCPQCQTPIPGLWPSSRAEVRLGKVEDLWVRVPRAVRG